MLGSPMLKTSSSERTLLKNLGAFLGRLTIAKNRPVLQVGTAAGGPPAMCSQPASTALHCTAS